MSADERCPTCGGTGPDQFDRVGDYGGEPYEARCGDDWHDQFMSPSGRGSAQPASGTGTGAIGAQLRRELHDQRVSMAALANVLGCTQTAVSYYANDKREPSLSRLCAIADALGVTTDYLLGRVVRVADGFDLYVCPECGYTGIAGVSGGVGPWPGDGKVRCPSRRCEHRTVMEQCGRLIHAAGGGPIPDQPEGATP